MSGTKFFRILVVCVALLVGTVGLTSIALAGPSEAYNGFVEFPGQGGVNMWNDGSAAYVGVRTDPDNDYSILLTIKGGDLEKAEFICGWPPDDPTYYNRRVGMNIGSGGAVLTSVGLSDPIELAFRTIFLSQNFGDPQSLIGHLRGKVKSSGNSYVPEYVDIIADTITRAVLTAPGVPGLTDDDLEKYYFSSYTDLDAGDQHLVYGLNYPSCTVLGPDQAGKWTVTFSGTPVELFVYKLPDGDGGGGGGKGNNGKGNKAPPGGNSSPADDYTDHVTLGTYTDLEFTYTTRHDPDFPNAPGKFKSLSVLWGDIKSQ